MHATVVSRIEYAVRGAGWYISVQPLTARVSASGLIGYCNDDLPAVADLFSTADDEFFRRVTYVTPLTFCIRTCLSRLTFLSTPYPITLHDINQ